jgi:hypothetical protein
VLSGGGVASVDAGYFKDPGSIDCTDVRGDPIEQSAMACNITAYENEI